jgi:rubredoxin---NAD+ reductase
MATQLGAVVRTRTRVTALEPGAHRISTGDEQLSYSRLVLATGAGQIRLDLAGEGAADVRWVNSLDDYAAFRTAVAGKRRIAIIGAGLIGCEFANDLALGGYEVAVIDIAGQPLPRLLPPAGGTMLREKLAALGIAWHFGVSVTRVEREAGRLAITLSDTSVLEADVVLSAVGLRPDTALARAAGAAVNFGIVTNRNLETSLPDVYALGDCAEVEGLVLPFVMPIMHAARALASTLAGKPAALSYPAMPVLVKTPACQDTGLPDDRIAAGARCRGRMAQRGDRGRDSVHVSRSFRQAARVCAERHRDRRARQARAATAAGPALIGRTPGVSWFLLSGQP